LTTATSDLAAPAAPAWFRFRQGGAPRLGAVTGGGSRAFDLGPVDELAALGRGELTVRDLEHRIATARPLELGSVRFDIPVARPGKLLCLGKNFAAHAAEFGAEVPEEPIFFTKLPDTLLPHEGTVVLPHWVETRIDHEIELAVILGFEDRDGTGRRYVPRESAMELVAGYTVLNDVTARKMQGDDRGKQQPWLRSKSFDTFCPIGPWVVPADGLDASDLAIDLWVDDEHRQHSRTSRMVVDVAAAIEWLSRHTTLRPGDILAMGTPEGVGPIHDDQVMIGAIEGIGVLRNPVARESAR
jgi:2-keto-4-pentenoate hydratase/2-oxohepta-3-ene-1,7-dioic acid hydratase in catechol pathway